MIEVLPSLEVTPVVVDNSNVTVLPADTTIAVVAGGQETGVVATTIEQVVVAYAESISVLPTNTEITVIVNESTNTGGSGNGITFGPNPPSNPSLNDLWIKY